MESRQLENLRRDLVAWRTSESKGRLIPESLWQRAAQLARSMGVTRVSRELGLGYNHLKRRMTDKPRALEPAPSQFVEWALPPQSEIEGCVLKIESSSGARMQAEISGVTTESLSRLLRDFGAN